MALGLGLGCNNGSGNGGGGGGTAAAYIDRLQECGLLTEGETPALQEDLDPESACVANCLLAATCEDLSEISCDAFTAMPDPALTACIDTCLVGPAPFTCGDGSTVPGDYQCDGEPDCVDASDEADCVPLTCADGNGTYPMSFKCDGGPDCEDGSDELDCPGFVACTDGSGSIPMSYQCDGEPDCDDGSDELGCPSFACANGEVVVGGARCDLSQDCSDNSDEAGCAQLVCP
ncbi:Transposase [Enhygromyxa salina]|uniref:Transposase n=1 Tax=Enhygromyxa salina TaxID=215803 RepID=A0A0C2D244_9BACT|nr:Transposase [Enhygromyxa salina]